MSEQPFPLTLREHRFWRHFVEYVVDDLAAEVAFLEQLGFEEYFAGDDVVLKRSPDHDVTLGVRRADDEHEPAPPSSVSVQFFVDDAHATERALAERGVAISVPAHEASGMCELEFRSPAGIRFHVWSMPA